MRACKETDARESPNESTLAGGEGKGSRGETYHRFAVKVPFPPWLNTLY
jgi:hypothetical protein